VWPTKPNNPSFDFLTIFNECIHFYQVTVEENAMKKIKEDMVTKENKKGKTKRIKFEHHYDKLLKQIKSNSYQVKYFLILWNKKNSSAVLDFKNYEIKENKIKIGKTEFGTEYPEYLNSEKFDYFSLGELGKLFDSKILKKFNNENDRDLESSEASMSLTNNHQHSFRSLNP
jgi:hypothetical protein